MSKEYNSYILNTVYESSSNVAKFLSSEMSRQDKNIELIASENYPSDAVMAAAGSIFCAKYTEGYPADKTIGNKGRYYGSCENYDKLELYGIEVFQKLFNAKDYYFNLQPHSGSSANCIAYSTVLDVGDTVLAMDMNSGAHLTHSSSASFVSKLYDVHTYGIDENGNLNYDDILNIAKVVKPKLIVCGASAYPKVIDFKKFKEIADTVGAYLMADISHISTLCAKGLHPTPFGYCDLITFTTQKIFRGNRGGVVACTLNLAKKLDSACFPRWQGGALQNMVAAKVIAAEEACTEKYNDYVKQVVKNAKAMRDEFAKMGYDVSDTDTHMFFIDFSKTHPNLTGKMIQDELDKHHITVNKNCVPNEKRSPMQASGIRIGTPAMTTRGFVEKDFVNVAHKIDEIIKAM